MGAFDQRGQTVKHQTNTALTNHELETIQKALSWIERYPPEAGGNWIEPEQRHAITGRLRDLLAAHGEHQ